MLLTSAGGASCRATVAVPGDKSITHRALLLAALARGTSEVVRPLEAEDTRSTQRVLQQLGVQITPCTLAGQPALRVLGQGGQFVSPDQALDCGNSGTTLRLLAGLLAGARLTVQLTGDASLLRRPMGRVVTPLLAMGAQIRAAQNDCAPLWLGPATTELTGRAYALPMASAQVKSALLLAALAARGTTTLTGALSGRDHTERMLPAFGGQLRVHPDTGAIVLLGPQTLTAARVVVPGDPSSAAFFWAAAAVLPNGQVHTPQVSLNPTRLGFLRLLQRMGARVTVVPRAGDAGEPMGDVTVAQGPLRAVAVAAHEVPHLVDEVPLLFVLACRARGTTRLRGAQELRFKESDRLAAMAHNLRAMGVSLQLTPDGFALTGPQPLGGGQLESFDDHRVAMACMVAALLVPPAGRTWLRGADCVAVSYPGFAAELAALISR